MAGVKEAAGPSSLFSMERKPESEIPRIVISSESLESGSLPP